MIVNTLLSQDTFRCTNQSRATKFGKHGLIIVLGKWQMYINFIFAEAFRILFYLSAFSNTETTSLRPYTISSMPIMKPIVRATKIRLKYPYIPATKTRIPQMRVSIQDFEPDFLTLKDDTAEFIPLIINQPEKMQRIIISSTTLILGTNIASTDATAATIPKTSPKTPIKASSLLFCFFPQLIA